MVLGTLSTIRNLFLRAEETGNYFYAIQTRGEGIDREISSSITLGKFQLKEIIFFGMKGR